MQAGSQISALLVLVGSALLLSGCGTFFVAKYRSAVVENRSTLIQLELGMTTAEVLALMGEGEIVSYRKIQMTDPWRSEAFLLKDGTPVRILYYLTERQRNWKTVRDEDLTPLVFEDDRLVGWGWSYLRRETDRYGITAPLEQR